MFLVNSRDKGLPSSFIRVSGIYIDKFKNTNFYIICLYVDLYNYSLSCSRSILLFLVNKDCNVVFGGWY